MFQTCSQIRCKSKSLKLLLQVELVGQDIIDYVHPCDHQELKKLVPVLEAGSQDDHVEVRKNTD